MMVPSYEPTLVPGSFPGMFRSVPLPPAPSNSPLPPVICESPTLFCSRRTLSFAYVLEFSTSRQEKLDVEAKAFYG